MLFPTWLRKRSSKRASAGRFRPRLEALEGREVPSTFYAANAADLIADISAANAAGGANTIVLTAPTSSPYELTAVNNTTDGTNGLPVISGGSRKVAADNLTILGNGDIIERSTAAGTPPFRLFDVASGGSLTLEEVVLQNGFAYGAYGPNAAEGGAIRNAGTLVLSQVVVSGSEALGFFLAPSKHDRYGLSGNASGGGIYSSGSLTVGTQTVVQGNTVIGAGLHGNGYGGGISIAGGTATISNSTIGADLFNGGEGNHALGGYDAATGTYSFGVGAGAGYGGGVSVVGGTATFRNDVIQSNSAGAWFTGIPESFNDNGYGGGIAIGTGATVYLDSVTVSNTHSNTGLGPSATTDIDGSYTLLP